MRNAPWLAGTAVAKARAAARYTCRASPAVPAALLLAPSWPFSLSWSSDPPPATATPAVPRTHTRARPASDNRGTPASPSRGLPWPTKLARRAFSAPNRRLPAAGKRVMDPRELNVMADQVLAVCATDRMRRHVLADLEVTQSAEATLNRIFDGTFLTGARLDPPTAASSSAAPPGPRLTSPPRPAGGNTFSEPSSPGADYDEVMRTSLQEEGDAGGQVPLIGSRTAGDSARAISSGSEIDLTLSAPRYARPAALSARTTKSSLSARMPAPWLLQAQPTLITIDSSDVEQEANGLQRSPTTRSSFRPRQLLPSSPLPRVDDYGDGMPVTPSISTAANLRPSRISAAPAVVYLCSDSDDPSAGAKLGATDAPGPPPHTSLFSSSQPLPTSTAPREPSPFTGTRMTAAPSRSNSLPPNLPQVSSSSIFQHWNVPSDSDSEGLPDLPLNAYIEDTIKAASQVEESDRLTADIIDGVPESQAGVGRENCRETTNPAARKSSKASCSAQMQTALDAESGSDKGEGEGLRPAKKRQRMSVEQLNVNVLIKETKRLSRERGKEELRLAKEAERARKKEEKECARLKKAALLAANRRKTREEAVLDVIVEIDARWKARSPASKEVDKLVEALGCQMIEDANPPLPGLVRWQRKHTAVWNKAEGRFDPLPPDRCYVAEERFRAIIIDGDEFAALCEGAAPGCVGALLPPAKLEAHLAEFRARYPDGQLAYVIEGLEKYYRKVRSAENRRFTSVVRGTNAPSQGRSGSAGACTAGVPDKDTVENALCWLQVFGNVKVVTAERADETVAWFRALTRELAVLPISMEHDRVPDGLNFCAHQGQVRSGATYSAVWQRCLEEVHLVTPAIVRAITRLYPTPRSLYEAFVECELQGGKPEGVLADIQVHRDFTSNAQPRRLGPALSARLYQIFRLTDPMTIIS